MDKIVLEGMRLSIRVGTTEQERSEPQLCCIDLTLKTKLNRAGKSGKLEDTVDYAAIFRSIEALCAARSFTLLEEVGERICAEILKNYSVAEVKLKASKLSPFTHRLMAVGIEIKRKKKKDR
jgi:7,8-dihydroneopterin aldolase/epimerase/oxygenase